MDFTEFLEKLVGYLKSLWRFRWIALGVTVIMTAIGWSVIAFIPDYYKAQAKVFIDTQSLLQPLMKDISVPLDAEVRIKKMSRIIFSRPNLERIAQMSDLDLNYTTKSQKDAFLKQLEYDIQLQQIGNSNFYNISYHHPDPAVSKLLVQSVLNLFMELTLSDTRTDTVLAQKFIDEQIVQYEQRLVVAEQKLAQFKRDHIDHLPREDKTYYDNLQNLMAQLEETEVNLAIAQKRREDLEQQLRGETPILGVSNSDEMTAMHPLMRKKHELEEILHQMQLIYTDKHPDIIKVMRDIGALDAQIKQEQDTQAWAYSADELNQNPVFQQIKIQLSEVKAEIAALEEQRTQITKQAKAMEQKVDQIINAEANLANLNRDYHMNKEQYNSLLFKRDAAKMVEDIDDTSENLTFRIVDPPYTASIPVWPKRGLFNFAVLIASMLGGIGTAFVMSQWKPAFYDRLSLEKTLSLPVLSIIPRERNPEQRRSALTMNAVYTGVLISLWAAFILLYLLTGHGGIME